MKNYLLLFFICISATLHAQHHFAVENKQVLWERHFKTSETDVLAQLGKVKKLHFLQETSGNGLNIKFPCELAFGAEMDFDFKFTIVVREGGYLVSVREMLFEESEVDNSRSQVDNLILRFNRKELSQAKGAQATMACMDDFFTAFFKTVAAVPE